MRIRSLFIHSFRNLHSFSIAFDPDRPTVVVLGANGLGKSNLIEAIVMIFRELEGGDSAGFSYRLSYGCRGHEIDVDSEPTRRRERLKLTVDGSPLSTSEFRARARELLPEHVFGYYSGWSSRLEKQFDEPTRAHYRQLLDGPELPLRRFFFCRKDYSQLALLAFILSSSTEDRKLLAETLQIEELESALFVLKRPRNSSSSGKESGDADPRFWNVSGAFLGILERLWELSLAPIRRTETVDLPLPHGKERVDRLYLFLKDSEAVRSLQGEFTSPKLFFSNLESLVLCDLLDELRIWVRKKDGSRVHVVQLSEGEQQLLTVLGLIRFTQNEEALYLLDEPDTHLNPAWTHNFLPLLQNAVQADKGHLLVATHNPLMIGALYRAEVRVLSQEGDAIKGEAPQYDPIGMGIEGLLKSELYGLRSSLAPQLLEKLDEYYRLLGLKKLKAKETQRLQALATELNELGINRTFPNPYFELFATALHRRSPAPSTAVLTKDEIEAQAKLADEVLAEIIGEEKKRKRSA